MGSKRSVGGYECDSTPPRVVAIVSDSIREDDVGRHRFIEEYEHLVHEMIATMPLDEAMAAAVGGSYSEIGCIERDLLMWAGLCDGMSVIDLGCGSGRLSHVLAQSVNVQYLGIDIVQSLLDYAQSKSPPHYVFKLHHHLDIPATDHFADFVTAFSVFTHLQHAETYLYLEDIRRVLKPRGKLVFSFLEFADPSHWSAFASQVDARRQNGSGQFVLNTMIERPVIEHWAKQLGYTIERFVDGNDAPWDTNPLGQAVAILRP